MWTGKFHEPEPFTVLICLDILPRPSEPVVAPLRKAFQLAMHYLKQNYYDEKSISDLFRCKRVFFLFSLFISGMGVFPILTAVTAMASRSRNDRVARGIGGLQAVEWRGRHAADYEGTLSRFAIGGGQKTARKAGN